MQNNNKQLLQWFVNSNYEIFYLLPGTEILTSALTYFAQIYTTSTYLVEVLSVPLNVYDWIFMTQTFEDTSQKGQGK